MMQHRVLCLLWEVVSGSRVALPSSLVDGWGASVCLLFSFVEDYICDIFHDVLVCVLHEGSNT